MEINERAGTGITGFDKAIDQLRLGDNVVWQVDSVTDYKHIVDPYVTESLRDKRRLVYIRFGSHDPVIDNESGIISYKLDPAIGFESFANQIHFLMRKEGRKTFYVFDCLTDLLEYWHSDLMIGNFFKVVCPYLYELDTIAYFAIKRNKHTYSSIAGIRETTQLLLDLYRVNDNYYIHPLKVWERYSPTMFFPHLIQGEQATSITSSTEAAELFSDIDRAEERLDNWNIILQEAKNTLSSSPGKQEAARKKLMAMLVGHDSKMVDLCDKYFTLRDLLTIGFREVGTGFIGGKSVGMLLARKIIEVEGGEQINASMEPHDSFYLGSDIFYTYVVQNGWWKLRTRQKTKEGYYQYAPEFKEKLLTGKFPQNIQEEFIQILEYFGQSPIIVRSSSLLEDSFGNAFAGKYESVFCVNQGSLEDRYKAFENAIRTVYASTMNEDALQYRMNRELSDKDEQMAILVQRVSGDHYQDLFFPHIAGVGNSSNLYVYDDSIDMEAGMLRMVFGLGTRAVDRTVSDYAKIVTLDKPHRLPLMYAKDKKKFAQRDVDLLCLSENRHTSRRWREVSNLDIKVDKMLFATPDYEMERRMRDLGSPNKTAPLILDFQTLLEKSPFPHVMKDILSLLSEAYDYPVDIEFTANFSGLDHFKMNLVQCRPLQTRGLGPSVDLPRISDEQNHIFSSKGHFMGGNARLAIEYVVYVDPSTYATLDQQGKYAIARQIGKINTALKGHQIMLIGPGRWGTTTPSLGVPVHFSEISHMSVICEIASAEAGFMPEVSYGSHFFQDLVESGIFYVAIFDGQEQVRFYPEKIQGHKNLLLSLLPDTEKYRPVIHVAQVPGMEVLSDIITQRVMCIQS